MTEAAFLTAVEPVLDAAAHPVEIVWRARRGGLTRFANNGVHQHAETNERQCIVRSCHDGRFGVVTTSDITESGLQDAVARSKSAAAYGPAAPGGLAQPNGSGGSLPNDIPRTKDTTPHDRVDALGPLLETASSKDWTAAGAYSTEAVATGVASTTGVRAWHEWTDATFSATVMREDGGSAWVERRGIDTEALAIAEACAVVLDKAERATSPVRVEPGRHTVVLEPAAVGELLQFLGWLGFGARAYLDGTSFLAGRMDERITGDRVTIVDDIGQQGAGGMPFDYEGTPRQRTVLIEDGVGRAVAHDTTTAAEAHCESTGHGLPQPNTFGPLPLHMVMQPGDTPTTDLLGQVDNGILVTRLWYNRVVDPADTRLTGLTRDGTFRIENGEIGDLVQDFRYNESILDAFGRIVAMGNVVERTEGGFVPALVIEDFTFSAVTGAA